MLTAIEYMGAVGVGVTSPQFFRADNGKVYVVKLQNRQMSSKILVNEWVAAQIGKWMGLCFPSSDKIQVAETFVQNNECLRLLQAMPGEHFASEYFAQTEYVSRHSLGQIINRAEMAGVILFDHLFYNKDRANNKKNLIMRQEDGYYKFYAIDHSHLFGSGKWSLESISRIGKTIKIYYGFLFGILLKKYLRPENFSIYTEKIQMMSDEFIDKIVQEIPSLWLTDPLEIKALGDCIKLRRDLAAEMTINLCRQIPVERGGRNRWHNKIITLK